MYLSTITQRPPPEYRRSSVLISTKTKPQIKMAKKKAKKGNFKNKVRTDSERQKSASSRFGYLNLPSSVQMFNPEPGSRIKLDIMPYEVTDPNHPDRYDDEGVAVPGELWYKRPFRIHRDIGAENETVVCPRSVGKRCPICDYREKRMNQGADKEETDAFKTSLRNLYVVIPKDSDDHEKKPHVMDISQFNFQKLLNEELEEDEENAVFPDLEEGRTLKIRFDSKTFGNSRPFAEASRIDFYERKKPYDESILDKIPNLDELLNILNHKELEAKFLELDEEDISDEEVEEEEEKPSRKKKSSGKKKKKEEPEEEEEDEEDLEEDEDEDEDEDLEEDEDEEEEEEDDDWDDDDDDDWDEDEDEDEEPPKKSTKKKAKK